MLSQSEPEQRLQEGSSECRFSSSNPFDLNFNAS